MLLTDWLGWGSPLYSLLDIVDYTFVRGQSSGGFQPWHFYLATLTDWTNLPVVVLSLMAFRVADWKESATRPRLSPF